METDILLEGFMEAERVHGLRYMKFIGDGDSSIHPTLIQNVPVWGHAIQNVLTTCVSAIVEPKNNW